MQSTVGAAADVAERLSRIPCLLIFAHWLQLMGMPNPRWFNQCNDGRLARYFTAIYCKWDGVLLMTPLPFSAHPPLSVSFPWSQFFFFSSNNLFHTCTHTSPPLGSSLCFLLLHRLPQQRQISKTRGLGHGRISTLHTGLPFYIIVL